ncbi:preprotein translocase subunit SecG [Pontibacter sp. G13]|uniref:preprotein translocase subunit SecG n=1 Tax=Pontibacter sp. G13 TaxID=3074898 RepID=UPI002889AB89|nr:preprotein translocase subunit SecG [Pontibacter sp. G13]WNJ18090.1 preprotein translocase subunit SecG [Pontibacter sp. G13]
MIIILVTLCLLVAIALIFVVVIQNSKGGGLSSTFGGGASQIMGARRSTEFIEKATWYLAAALAVIALTTHLLPQTGTTTSGSRVGSYLEESGYVAPAPTLPSVEQVQEAAEDAAAPAGDDQ